MAHGNPYARWLSPYAADTPLTDVLVPHIPVCGASCAGAGHGGLNLGETTSDQHDKRPAAA